RPMLHEIRHRAELHEPVLVWYIACVIELTDPTLHLKNAEILCPALTISHVHSLKRIWEGYRDVNEGVTGSSQRRVFPVDHFNRRTGRHPTWQRKRRICGDKCGVHSSLDIG